MSRGWVGSGSMGDKQLTGGTVHATYIQGRHSVKVSKRGLRGFRESIVFFLLICVHRIIIRGKHQQKKFICVKLLWKICNIEPKLNLFITDVLTPTQYKFNKTLWSKHGQNGIILD